MTGERWIDTSNMFRDMVLKKMKDIEYSRGGRREPYSSAAVVLTQVKGENTLLPSSTPTSTTTST